MDGLSVARHLELNTFYSREVERFHQVEVLAVDGDAFAELRSGFRHACSLRSVHIEVAYHGVLSALGAVVVCHFASLGFHGHAYLNLAAGVLHEVLCIHGHVVEEHDLTDVPDILTLDGDDFTRVHRVGRHGRHLDFLAEGDVGLRNNGVTALGHDTQLAWHALVGNGHHHLLRVFQAEFCGDKGGRRSEFLVSFREDHFFHIIQMCTSHSHGLTTCDRHGTEAQDVHTAFAVRVGVEVVLATTDESSSGNQCSQG